MVPTSKKVITVFGATGNQGGSVISELLSSTELSSEYTIRAVSRDLEKPSALALKVRGVELVKADLSEPASLQSALSGSDAVFAVTNFWESQDPTLETRQGQNIVDASIANNVRHLILSTLPSVKKMTDGRLNHVVHFDSKADISVYAEAEKKKTGLIVTHFMPAYFMSNIKDSVRRDPHPQDLSNRGLVSLMPWSATTTHVPMFAPREDTGKFVAGALKLGAEADGKVIQAASDWKTPAEIFSTISRVAGAPEIKFVEIEPDVFESFFPAPMGKELAETLTLIKEYQYYGKGSKEKQAERGDPFVLEGKKTTSWEDYVRAHGPWEWK